jgi:hypothetical protein
VNEFANEHKFSPVTRDTYGYHRRSRSMRRDTERQTPNDAALEMAEQGRQIHRMEVSFRFDRRQSARLAFDRNASLSITKGNPVAAVLGLLLPGVIEAAKFDEKYKVERTSNALQQEIVQVEFPDDVFLDHDSCRALCAAVRVAGGLNVAVIHLNPYLQAQILDFYTGGSIDMLVLDSQRITLVPRSVDAKQTMQRVADTIQSYFGEGKVSRQLIRA